VDGENANYDFLMGCDIDYARPDVVEETRRWAKWIVKELHLDGFRLDAIKHIDRTFIKELVDYLREDYPEFFVVGEYWKDDPESLDKELKGVQYNLSLFDVHLHYKFKAAGDDPDNFDMAQIFEDTLVKNYPEQAVAFIDNHDSQPGQALESFVADWFKPLAYALILLRRDGYPCIFYGDFYGVGPDSPAPVEPKRQVISRLLRARQKFAVGLQKDYFDDARTVGWVRLGRHADQGEDGGEQNEEFAKLGENQRAAVLISTSDEGGEKSMWVGEDARGQKWIDVLGHAEGTVTIDDEGVGVFRTNGKSVSVWALAEKPFTV